MLGKEKFKGRERRRFVRWHGELSAGFVIFSDVMIPHVPAKIEGVIRDLSAIGLRAVIRDLYNEQKEGLLVGAVKIGLIVQLDRSKDPVKAIGRMIWMKDSIEGENVKVIGLEFSDITTVARDTLRNFIIDYYVK